MTIRPQDIQTETVVLPETIFVFGAGMDNVSQKMRELDKPRGPSIGNIIYSTPPRWVFLPKFAIQKRMVTNGEYKRFLSAFTENVYFYNNAEFWYHVWKGMGFNLSTVITPYEVQEGQILEFNEFYSNADTFGEAYITSIGYEVQRALQATEGHEDVTPPPNAEVRQDVLNRLLTLIKYLLRPALTPGDLGVIMTETEYNAMRSYYDAGGPGSVRTDIDYICQQLSISYAGRAHAKHKQMLKSGQAVGDAMIFLKRVRKAIEKIKSLDDVVPLHAVLFPRDWSAPEGQVGGASGRTEAAEIGRAHV